MANYNLTKKQEGFVIDLIAGLSQADAYRKNYNTENMQDNTIYSKASLMMSDKKIRARYDELMAKHQNKAIMKRDDLLRGLKLAFEMALGQEPTPVAVKNVIDGALDVQELKLKNADLKAVSGIAEKIAKLEGWLTDRVKHDVDEGVEIVIKKAVKVDDTDEEES